MLGNLKRTHNATLTPHQVPVLTFRRTQLSPNGQVSVTLIACAQVRQRHRRTGVEVEEEAGDCRGHHGQCHGFDYLNDDVSHPPLKILSQFEV
ncbi:hypothetical protein TcasGA2_TC014469 [Tribolium castaneum]|uniref:Uncharacterized protein n=1 Tax=Tribolium castaneum TaxID=7070 RepID=D6WM42_TRICA|nr:hypothetical protein TcasGA2_TC014469 [Tribolium castaneum]